MACYNRRMTKHCEVCGVEIVPRACDKGHPSHFAKRRFCSRSCGAAPKRTKQPCTCVQCGIVFQTTPSQIANGRKFCSNACYQRDHAATPRTCPTCGKSFVHSSYSASQIHCSMACRPMYGKSNPNYGKRHEGMPPSSPERRLAMSEERQREGNPNWKGGSPNNGRYRMQTRAAQWARTYLGTTCDVCGAPNATLHHIVPRRLFGVQQHAHFAQNLVMLCVSHHQEIEKGVRRAVREAQWDGLPYGDRLPKSILSQLAQDGFVSSLPDDCDLSPLGSVAPAIRQLQPENDRAA